MRHKKHTFKIGRTGAHRTALLANQVCSLIFSKEIKTTIVKAKETKRLAEKMVTLAKKGTLHARRLAISKLRNEDAVKVLFEEFAPKYMERKGGYTRIIQLGRRIGDAAEICMLQWVGEIEKAETKPVLVKKPAKKSEEKKA
jgi:large subunit ribosomal protein L17